MTVAPGYLRELNDGEAFFLGQVAGIDEDQARGPSLLPQWSRAHVVAHVARNAHGIRNLLTWAATGQETPMYASPGNREADIDRDARLPMDELRAKLEEESAGLRRQVAEMPATAWNHEVRSAKGASIIASRLPWLRTREVWVHAVDLDTGARFNYLPSEVFTGLFHERLGTLASSASCPSMALVDTDSGRAYEVGASGPQVHVSGPAPVLLGWLLGRDPGALLTTDSDTGHPPDLPTWP